MTLATLIIVHTRPEIDPAFVCIGAAILMAVLIIPCLAWRG